MKSLIKTLLFAVLGIAWVVLANYKFQGLNSIHNLFGFGDGLVHFQANEDPNKILVQNSGFNATVLIDSLGIPHIFSDDMESAAFALGYAHAKDRYFQMELLANTVQGKLSEIIGPNGIGSDWFWKGFQLEEKAKESLSLIEKENQELFQYLQSYTEGINHYVASVSTDDLDPMYIIWDYQPDQWEAHYAFFLQWYMSMNLAFYDDYVAKQEILDKLPADIRAALYPDQPLGQPTIVPSDTRMIDSLLAVKEDTFKVFSQNTTNEYDQRPTNKSLGSNNWVVAASKTKDKSLFLCNDLHLNLVAPNLMYEFHLATPELQAYGFTVPGLPFVLSGHNDKVAWGITNGGWDVTEPYLLKVNPENNQEYWMDGKWETLETRESPIQVKNGSPIMATHKISRFGPVIVNDSLSFAIKWHPNTLLTGISSFWKLMHAKNWPSFKEALRDYDYPSQNFIFADTDGNIGVISAGKMPIKPAGYNGGLLDGTLSPDWAYIPFDSLPSAYNPEKGFLFSANQQPAISKQYFSSRWYEDLYRPRRIDELLRTNNSIDFEYMKEMQLDRVDPSVADVQQILQKYRPDLLQNKAWEGFFDWDGNLTPNNKYTHIFTAFRQSIDHQLGQIAQSLKVQMKPSYDQYLHYLLSDNNSSGEQSGISDNQTLVDSLVAWTDQAMGGSAAYSSVIPIPQITFLPVFNKFLASTGGNENTVNVNYGVHPVIRTIIQLDENGIQSFMVNATGQTGKINDDQYFQQLEDWRSNKLHHTQFSDQADQLVGFSQEIIFQN